MKIIAFQIKNYRSIVDSGKCFLSPDHITSLIGQNESGKTSVLEALKSFYDGIITDDVLRSDLTFPEITCIFSLDKDQTLADLVDRSAIPVELIQTLESKKEICITRKWNSSKNNTVFVAEEEIVSFFKRLEHSRIHDTDKILASISELTLETENSTRELQNAELAYRTTDKDITRLEIQIDDQKRKLGRSKNTEVLAEIKQNLDKANLERDQLKNRWDDIKGAVADKAARVQLFALKMGICRQFTDRLKRMVEINNEIRTLNDQIKEGEFRLRACKNDREARSVIKNIDLLKENRCRLSGEKPALEKEITLSRKIASRVLEGMEVSTAEQQSLAECRTEEGYATPETMGISVWKHIPVFEFFEDFSSLLPNKIDLDDLLNENTQAEGYKAARNFLFIAGLNADFFREENHRILKQKIENLNTEITVDFQDYWRQSLGKNDKITINFELEHYDLTQPDKSGKPYLEFWIKDKQERLYPKQRSRGVRWFLSFYLELKATAKSNHSDRIMLIDEPGLSLHARAQEDVLKVFEDLRQNLQIIYSTHSPNLIDLKKLYRIMAVQRARETDDTSETVILDSRCLNEASSETLSPVYALMGTRLNERQFVFPENNYIVEDAVTFHYLEAMSMLFGIKLPVHYLPASDPSSIPTLANLLFGWKVSFGLILTDNQVSKSVADLMKNTMFFANGSAQKMIVIEGMNRIEDLFSTIDFKRFILKQRVGITMRNSEYIDIHKLSRMILVSDFHSRIKDENLQFSDFDDETRQNFINLFDRITHSIGLA